MQSSCFSWSYILPLAVLINDKFRDQKVRLVEVSKTINHDHKERGLGRRALAQNSEYNFVGENWWGSLKHYYNLRFYAALNMFFKIC